MKRKSLKSLTLNKKSIANLKSSRIRGGGATQTPGYTCDNGCNTMVTITDGQPFDPCD